MAVLTEDEAAAARTTLSTGRWGAESEQMLLSTAAFSVDWRQRTRTICALFNPIPVVESLDIFMAF